MQQQATRVPYDQCSTNFRVYELVAAGAIGIVLKLIHSVSQSELDNEEREERLFYCLELLLKIYSNHNGVESLRTLPALFKKLQSLVEELTRKATTNKRNCHGVATREKQKEDWRGFKTTEIDYN
ncbi:hypothetical protein GH714_037319 [Hevea brasiliensis]|uniref:Uncharacterized protein n=1 Tax=Hevea brasiliensis TaxID=3981 RepID=A0A6A6LWK9_HEVBR|nr:hypothetical protein GH714_037319 [Hevea brasiliensis]